MNFAVEEHTIYTSHRCLSKPCKTYYKLYTRFGYRNKTSLLKQSESHYINTNPNTPARKPHIENEVATFDSSALLVPVCEVPMTEVISLSMPPLVVDAVSVGAGVGFADVAPEVVVLEVLLPPATPAVT